MSARPQYDLVVIGGGIAGMTAAARAAELGLKTCVLEKGREDRYACNTRYSGGTVHICLRDIMDDPAELRATIDKVTDHNTSEILADTMATEGRRLIRWLQSQGIKFVKASLQAYQNWVLAPPRPFRPGLHWEGRGGDVMLHTLEGHIKERNGEFIRSARACNLVIREMQCVGVEAEVAGERESFDAKAVLIADGGFQANLDLVREHISPAPERLKQRGAATGMGDGLLMAREAGAKLTAMDNFYGHVLHRDAMTNDALWPYPVLDSLVQAGIVVDASGKRVADEGEGGVYMANSIARLADPASTYVIFDDAIWNGAGKRDSIPTNPHISNGGGQILQGQSVEALASAAGLPVAGLIATLNSYNEAVKNGATTGLFPSRRSDKYAPQKIEKPPYYAMPLCAGITYTMGGIAVNEHANVLSTSGAPIQGLYAAGSCVGGIDGGPAAGYVGGLSKAGVLGLRCAEHLARSLGKNVA